jgi:hypothetical protein
MKIIYWMFLISAALFVTGIGFIIAGARTTAQAPVEATAITPVASIRQIMIGITGPATRVVLEAVGTTISASGVEERAPKTDEDWETVGNSAAAVIESGNLILMSGRAIDTGAWVEMSQAMIDAAKVSLRAVESRNTEDLFASGEALNASCDTCHERYQRQ